MLVSPITIEYRPTEAKKLIKKSNSVEAVSQVETETRVKSNDENHEETKQNIYYG